MSLILIQEIYLELHTQPRFMESERLIIDIFENEIKLWYLATVGDSKW